MIRPSYFKVQLLPRKINYYFRFLALSARMDTGEEGCSTGPVDWKQPLNAFRIADAHSNLFPYSQSGLTQTRGNACLQHESTSIGAFGHRRWRDYSGLELAES